MLPADHIRLNLCLMPPEETTRLMVETASALPTDRQMFRVDRERRAPHLTMYMSSFRSDMLDAVADAAHDVMRRAPENLNCWAYGLTVSDGGFVEIGYSKTTQIAEFQMHVIEALARFRSVSAASTEGSSPLERAQWETYGYKLAADAFRPHISLAAYQEEGLPPRLQFARGGFSQFDFVPAQLCLVESDDFGAVEEVVLAVGLD